jgi:hypothetical protein
MIPMLRVFSKENSLGMCLSPSCKSSYIHRRKAEQCPLP